ncbi:unnamed protein product [Dicrocoelium dendriticum]|nr:unnamed protein product [Dicrocoelium dendriticum]
MGASQTHLCHSLNAIITEVMYEVMARYELPLSTMSNRRKRMIQRRAHRYVRSHIPHELIHYYCDHVAEDSELAHRHMSNLRALVDYAFQRAINSHSHVSNRTRHSSLGPPQATARSIPGPTRSESDVGSVRPFMFQLVF